MILLITAKETFIVGMDSGIKCGASNQWTSVQDYVASLVAPYCCKKNILVELVPLVPFDNSYGPSRGVSVPRKCVLKQSQSASRNQLIDNSTVVKNDVFHPAYSSLQTHNLVL